MTWELLNEEVGHVNVHPDKARLLGEVGVIEDSENSSANQQRLKNSGMPIFVRRVRFGGAYAAGTRVKYTSAYDGTRVEQAGAEPACGIVDPFLSANTASGDVGLIFTSGPMDVVSGADVAINDKLQGSASGRVQKEAGGYVEGTAIEAATAAGTSIRAYMDFPQVAPATDDIETTYEWVDDFMGSGTFGATPSEGDPWDITDTSAAGTPTYTRSTAGGQGEATLAFDSQAEAQNVCLAWNDILTLDIDGLNSIQFRVKMGQAAVDATTSLAFGVCTARNDAIDTIAEQACFRVIGSDSTTLVVCESDDATNNNDDVATSTTLINAYKTFKIDLSNTADVKFYIDGVQVATGTTFDMSNFTASLQPFVQIQKTSDANTDSVIIDYVKISGTRQ